MLIKNNIFINYLETFFLIASLLRGNESLKTIHSNIESNMGMLAKACGLIEKDLISCKKIELSIKQEICFYTSSMHEFKI